MKLLIQRVKEASVTVDETRIGAIGPGALVFLGIHKDDTADAIAPLLDKLLHLRVFHDSAGKMNLSLLDIGAELLIISQFTLYADTSSGRRPSFFHAAPPMQAESLYQQFVDMARQRVEHVQTGSFGAYMDVALINDGPVTLTLEV